ncbi:hypothetical protein E8E13_007526 [Curvularia kusanoi]|uniref:RelA/SpoT domain-containing protein n=1 Tax=Curvularia kusanoi TaxID=90978 RepID=A0A9P4TGZ9_CURKU|nr:hypothetical protein E8E13_007526 [Curvularia kusanoi]
MDKSLGEHPRAPSTLEEEVKEEFIAKNFSKRATFWEDLALLVKTELDKHLKQQIPVVHSTSIYRIKTKESLRGKDVIESSGLFEVIPDSQEQAARLFHEHGHKMKNHEIRPYQERMGYYEAQHYCIRLKNDCKGVSGYDDELVEIQVRTVLMDAWAEVRHDMDYKAIMGSATGDELRVLDAIKGSIMSCEILQDHLFVLRKQHLERDAERWTKASPNDLRISIIDSMSFEPGLRFLLDRFGSEPSEGALFRYTKELFERCDIHSLLEFRQTMARLIKIDEQPEKATKAQWALSSMYSSSQYRSTQKIDALANDALTLFQFVSILLLYAMDVEDIERRLWAPKYEHKDEDDEEDEEGSSDSSDTDEDDSEENGNYENNAKLTDVMPVIARLFCHFKAHIEDAWNREAIWLYTIATYLQWWEKHKVWLYTEDQRDWEIRRRFGMTVDKETLMDDCWIKGSQVAADIIGVTPIHLKHAALYRALLRGRAADDYAYLHLHDGDIDINCQDSCANFNLAFPDGLSLMHIAVVRANGAMIKQLVPKPNLDTKAIWYVGDLNFAKDPIRQVEDDYRYPYNNQTAKPRAPYWSQYDKRENWRPNTTWTAVKMAKRRCRMNADLQSLYEPLFHAASLLPKRSRKRSGK